MNYKKILIDRSWLLSLGVMLIGLPFPLTAQVQDRYPFGFKENIPTKYPVPHEYIREADCIWSKRVWRSIDLREKINHSLYYPLNEVSINDDWSLLQVRRSLWEILRHHVLKGDLTLFSPYNPNNVFGTWDGDQLKYPISANPGGDFFTDSNFRSTVLYYFGMLGPKHDVPLSDEFGEPLIAYDADSVESFVYPPRDTIYYTSKDIVQYHIKEDWFIDKERGKLEVRILGIAPVVYQKETVNGIETITGVKELFWIYFPHARFYLSNYEVFNSSNDAQWMSFDDLFQKRRFSSIIYKESNTMNRSIDTYKMGVEALRESNRIEEEIRNIEHDIWKF
ncbi:MAG: gliding motility protein GldN [Crocinitomicaceae bacterium]|jgi:gliding motility associated protien GldN|nr:gliding motility protein GldN [Crocinitomicaceae bacterium]